MNLNEQFEQVNYGGDTIATEEEVVAKEETNIVTVRWFDGYKEDFEATEVRFGNSYLWMRLKNGQNRHIPLPQVRWFALSVESHQSTGF